MPHLRTDLGFWTALQRHLNFFRIHLLFFTFTPLIFSVVLYASNGRYPIAYIDALYNSVSAVTVCGLGTVNLSQLTPWQQVLLFIQMCVGSPVVVSWFMVYIRRHFFAKKFEYIVQAEAARRAASKARAQQSSASASGRHNFAWPVTSLRRRTALSPVAEKYTNEDWPSEQRENKAHKKIRADMVRRTDAPPRHVDPSGWVGEGMSISMPLRRLSTKVRNGEGQAKAQLAEQLSSLVRSESPINLTSDLVAEKVSHAQTEDAQVPLNVAAHSIVGLGRNQPVPSGLGSLDSGTLQDNPPQMSSTAFGMPHTTTIEFAPTVTRRHAPLPTDPGRRSDSARGSSTDERHRRQSSYGSSYSHRYSGARRQSQASLSRVPSQHASQLTISQAEPDQVEASQAGLGGFPMPHKLLGMLFRRLFPSTTNRLQRTMTIPTTTTLSGGETGRAASISGASRRETIESIPEGSKPVPYISFDAIVGHNSTFQILTNEQLEELGGVEYRGLNALLWLVALYHFGSQLLSFVVIAPYMTMPEWASNFVPPALIRPVATPWFSLFQVVSSYTNTGFSLVDQSMLPFQTAYPMIFFMAFLTLAGNTGFPVFLRFMIWTIAKLVPTQSRLYETLHFLLDHPRRCFVYLFPAHQTWFLFLLLVLLNSIDFFCFMVLDIGNPDIESISLGTRFVAGILQAIDVRASGFSVIPIAALAPAVKVMYVIMMYISVCASVFARQIPHDLVLIWPQDPIAMSVRSTNVYEEQSLGIFHSDDQLSAAEQAFKADGSRVSMWGRYLAMHIRYQLSFDMWWLALALFLICIIERDNLINPDTQGWFNIFTIIFELVSAYGSVGLSVGIPTQNYSFSGAFRPLSKLVMCVVMIRGRHRGLPVAIDRAIVLPYEFERVEYEPDRLSRDNVGAISHPAGGFTDDTGRGQTIEEKERVGEHGVNGEHGSGAGGGEAEG